MRNVHAFVPLGVVAVFVAVFSSPAWAATPAFTIAATNVTMSSNSASGSGSSTFTLTSVNGYAGSVRVTCNASAPVAGVKIPSCSYGVATATSAAIIPAPPSIPLTASQVVTGTVSLYNTPVPSCSNPCPASLPHRENHGLAHGLAFAGALLFGLGFWRRRARWLTLVLLAVGSLAGVAGISACGSNSIVTPGTYTYSINAMDTNTAVSVNTSIQVTVP